MLGVNTAMPWRTSHKEKDGGCRTCLVKVCLQLTICITVERNSLLHCISIFPFFISILWNRHGWPLPTFHPKCSSLKALCQSKTQAFGIRCRMLCVLLKRMHGVRRTIFCGSKCSDNSLCCNETKNVLFMWENCQCLWLSCFVLQCITVAHA